MQAIQHYGIVISWFQDKQLGVVRDKDDTGSRLLLLAADLPAGYLEPKVGDEITYIVGTDDKNRPCALSPAPVVQANPAAREGRVRLKRDLAGHPLPLQGDPVLLQLMLRNLIDNAVRYSPEESEVGLYFYPDRIEIRDHGAGIAAEHLPRIKERF